MSRGEDGVEEAEDGGGMAEEEVGRERSQGSATSKQS